MKRIPFISRYWYLAWIINALVAAGLFGFYQTFIAAHEARAQALRYDLAILEKNRRLLKEREELFAVWQPHNDRFDRFFFTKDRLVEWLEFLEGEARMRRLAFEASSLDEGSLPAGQAGGQASADNPLRLRVALRGNLSDTIQFLRAVETGPYGIGVKEGVARKGPSSNEHITQLIFLLYAQ